MRQELRRKAHGRYLYIIVISLAMSLGVEIQAWDLSWEPRISVGTRATDNLRTRIDDQEAAWGFDTGGGVEIKGESGVWRSVLTPAFNIRRFAIGEDSDAEEYQVRTQNQWAFHERALATLDFDYIRNSTLTTELDDTGRQNAVANRDTISVRPGITYALTDRTSLNTGFLFSDVSFEDIPGAGFTDYDYKQFNAGVTHAYDATLSFFSTGYVSEFRTPQNGGKSLTYGGQGGAIYQFSETLDGTFAVGYTQSVINFRTQQLDGFRPTFDPATGQIIFVPVFSFVENQVTESGPIASARLRKAFEHLDAEIDYTRSVSPSSFGAQSISDYILVTLGHSVSHRTRVTFQGGYSMRSAESEALAAGAGRANLNRNQVFLSPAVRYRFTEELAVTANYRFIWNDLADINESSYVNAVFVTLTYNGEPTFYRGF